MTNPLPSEPSPEAPPELKEALEAFATAIRSTTSSWVEKEDGISTARAAISSLFSALTSEKERLRKRDSESERIIKGMNTEAGRLEDENGRLHRFATYVCQVLAMGNQADLRVEDLPK